MALSALTLSVTSGVQGRRFQATINGLTTGKVEVLNDGSPGFSTVNGKVMSHGLPYPVSTVVLREWEPGVGQGYRDTRIDITALTEGQLYNQALGMIGAGRSLKRYRVGGERQSDGSVVYSVFAEDDLGATGKAAAGSTLYEATRYWMGGSCTDFAANSVFTGAGPAAQFGTTLHCIELQGEFTEIQLILVNMSPTSAIEYVGASAIAVADMTDKKQDALFASEAKLFAFGQNGNPTITVPPRAGQSVSMAVTDWLPIAAKARTDGATAPAASKRSDGSLPYAVYVRLAQRAHDGVSTFGRVAGFAKNNTLANNAEWETGPAQVWAQDDNGAAAPNLTGAFPATPTYTTSNFTGYATIAGIRYRSKKKVMTVMFGGSSMSQGGSDDTRAVFGFQRGIYASSTAAQPVEACNFGMPTNTSTNARIGMQYAIPIIKPSHVMWEYWNPNSIGAMTTGTAQQFADQNAVLESDRALVFAAAQAVGAVGFVWNGAPRNTNATTSAYGAAQDGYRLGYLAALNGRGFEVADVNAAVGDNATPQRLRMTANGYPADFSIDFLHLEGDGYTAASVPVKATVETLKTAFFA